MLPDFPKQKARMIQAFEGRVTALVAKRMSPWPSPADARILQEGRRTAIYHDGKLVAGPGPRTFRGLAGPFSGEECKDLRFEQVLERADEAAASLASPSLTLIPGVMRVEAPGSPVARFSPEMRPECSANKVTRKT